MEIPDKSIDSITSSVVTHTASGEESDNLNNKNIEEEWDKYRDLWHTTINILRCPDFVNEIDYLHPFV